MLSLLFLSLSRCVRALKLPVKSFSAISISKTLRYASDINVNSKIMEVEGELKELEEVLRSTTGEERLLILKQIVAKEQQLTIWIKHLPIPGKNQPTKLNLSNVI